MKEISQIKLLENGYQASFVDGTAQFYRELIAVDFDGEASASYTNAQLDFALTGFDVKAAVSAADQSAILEKLNAEAADGVLYINAAQAAALPKSAYSTIYVGDTDAFAKLGNFAGIAETTGAFAAATKGDNAFVITGADFTADSLASTIAHEAGHLMGTVEHDNGNNGLTQDDFGTAWPSGRINQKTDINSSYEGVKTGRSATGVDGAAVHFAGGTMTIGKAGTVTSLNNNSAQWGGAISVDTKDGGSFNNTSKLTIQYTTFSQNTSVNGGGAINISNGKTSSKNIVEIQDCTFTGNTSGSGFSYGGAIFADEPSVKFTIFNSVFEQNKAENGGAIAILGSTATVSDSSFSGNQGGAIYMACPSGRSDTPTLTISKCSFNTSKDTITIGKNGKLTLKDTNTFAASVTKASNGTINGANNATYIFQQTTATNFQMTKLGSDSSVIFDSCQGTVNFNIEGTNSFSSTTVNTNKGIVGNFFNIGSGVTWLWNGATVTMNGKSVNVGTDSKSALYVTTDNKLYAKTLFAGRAMSANTGTDSIKFVSGTYTEDFGTVTQGGAKDVIGNGAANTRLKGTIYTDDYSLEMGKLTYDGSIYGGTGTINLGGTGENDFLTLGNGSRIYAGGQISADGEFGGSTLVTGKLTTNAGEKARIYGGCDVQGTNTKVTESGSINTTLDIADGSTVAFYGGARLYGGNGSDYTGSVTLGTVSTTISGGGIFSGFAGNGSQGNNGNVTQGDSSLTISGGSFTNYVYAGAYSQGSTSIVDGSTYLTIQGGVFDKVVFGGCAANTNKQARTTKVTGDTNITVDATGDSTITFKSHLIAGSQSCMEKGGAKQILGDTTITFKGEGSKIIFDEGSYVLGGSMLDKKEGVNSVGGERTLAFDGFTSTNFNANLDETFDTVKFTGSSVTLTGSWETLATVKTWEFDVSDDVIDLTWTNDSNTNINDFTGDTINLRRWDGTGTRTFMIGTDATLKGFNPDNVHVFDAAGAEIHDGFTIQRNDNILQILAKA